MSSIDRQTRINSQELELRAAGAVQCVACGSARNSVFFSIPRLPVNVGFTTPDAKSALEAEFGSIELAYCHSCTHIFNQAFEPNRVRYEPGYEVSLTHSSIFRHFMEELANRLVESFSLNEKRILEIGSGRGWFLKRLCELGNNRGLGIDPSTQCEGTLPSENGHVELDRGGFDDAFEERFHAFLPDFVCCLSVFEHIPQPLEFLQRLRRFIGGEAVGFYWEVFNAERAIAEQEVWSILYEQCNYFTLTSLVQIMQRAGFHVQHAGNCYGAGQYLYAEGVNQKLVGDDGGYRIDTIVPRDACEDDGTMKVPDALLKFASHFQETLKYWHTQFEVLRQQDARVVFWGSGGKGVNFLNLMETKDLISVVAEINPDKQGRFIPGTGQRIVAPDFLQTIRPDVIIISNALYKEEITAHAKSLGLECQIYVA